MEVRTVTIGMPLGYPIEDAVLERLAMVGRDARLLFGRAGILVRTVRLATQPFPEILGDLDMQSAVDFAMRLDALCRLYDIDFCSIGSNRADANPQLLAFAQAIPEIFANTERICASISMASRSHGICFDALSATAKAITDISNVNANGYANFRIAGLVNCLPNIPFFPAAYHQGRHFKLSIGLESADLANEAFRSAQNIDHARLLLKEKLHNTCRSVERLARALADAYSLEYVGIDTSLCPAPAPNRGIAEAVEALQMGRFGQGGSVFITALVTELLSAVEVK